jgi:hypothetical protein
VRAEAVVTHQWGRDCGSPLSAHVILDGTGLRAG